MNSSEYIFDVNSENFLDTISRDDTTPVVVDFWAPWCGPCKTLMPLLVKLAEEYGGKFILAKVNIDEEQALASQYGVRSVPTVKLFKQGQFADEFMGALPESAIREFLERHIARESDQWLSQARALMAENHLDEAAPLLEAVLAERPAHLEALTAKAELLLAKGAVGDAQAFLSGLPANIQAEPAIQQILDRIVFAALAEKSPDQEKLIAILAENPADSEARYQLAAHKEVQGDYAGAMDELLELMRRDRSFNDDAARKSLLKIFNLLGEENPLVGEYRRKMVNLLF